MALNIYSSISERLWYYIFRLLCVAVFLFLISPILIVLPMSFSSAQFLTFPPPGYSLQWYKEFFSNVDWTSAMKNSFAVGFATVILATVMGTAAAMGITYGKFHGKTLLAAFFIWPMTVPVIILAVGLYFVCSQMGLVGSFPGLVLAHSLLATPMVVIVVSATLQGFSKSMELAAASLGASPLNVFFRITLPIIAPGILSGALFAFITSFDEVVMALFLSGTTWRTLPVKMFEGIRYEINPTISAVAALLIVLSVFVLGTAELLRRRSLQRRGSNSEK
jgi:putative spermidine/putrescine transport system permease protein